MRRTGWGAGGEGCVSIEDREVLGVDEGACGPATDQGPPCGRVGDDRAARGRQAGGHALLDAASRGDAATRRGGRRCGMARVAAMGVRRGGTRCGTARAAAMEVRRGGTRCGTARAAALEVRRGGTRCGTARAAAMRVRRAGTRCGTARAAAMGVLVQGRDAARRRGGGVSAAWRDAMRRGNAAARHGAAVGMRVRRGGKATARRAWRRLERGAGV